MRAPGFKQWAGSGAPWIWLNAAAVTALLLLVGGLVVLIAFRGLAHFWPAEVERIIYEDADGTRSTILGQVHQREEISRQRMEEAGVEIPGEATALQRMLLKTGNRDLSGEDFRWILEARVIQRDRPYSAVVVERTEWGVFIGYLLGVRQNDTLVPGNDSWGAFQQAIARTGRLRQEINELERDRIGLINHQLEQLRLEERRMELDGSDDVQALAAIEAERAALREQYLEFETQLQTYYEQIGRDRAILQTVDGKQVDLPLENVIKAWRPNAMSLGDKLGHFLAAAWAFVSEEPREANTEGGVFPAIFGTVLMVLIMTVVVFPFGVIGGIWLREYARQGWLTRTVRIAVNNLAGVPSIVYGVFGLGFFVYAVGGSIDALFFEEALPMPTFGTGGLFWASLTLALLTLPVVIIATEEGLARIPRTVREGSLALGATRWETLWRTVLPMASPGIMTGLILAVARAAGEVAPLMLVGVVKLAPSLPVDGQFPYLHLERKFMHLGFHIYDVGFQSPNVEAARPLVYATALLLVLVTLLLNAVAIIARNRLRDKYRGLES